MSNLSRIAWLDYAKGIGIVLVVVGHVIRGLVNADLMPSPSIYTNLDAWIYSFHMPLFFFLSGLLLYKSLRKDFKNILISKSKRILYPYIVWSLIQGGMIVLLSNYTNDGYTLADLALIIIRPIEQFWFLYALFGSILLIATAAKVGVKSHYILIGAIAVDYLLPYLSIPFAAVAIVLNNLVYVSAGFFIGSQFGIEKINNLASSARVNLLMPLSFACGFILYKTMVSEEFIESGKAIDTMQHQLTAFFGILMVLSLSFLLSKFAVLPEVVKYGRLSLEIFVAHTIASAGFRIILDKFLGIDVPWLHLVMGILAGIYLPILLKDLVDRLNFRYLFVYP